ncbi:MAG: hypothetical protein A4S14_16385 [Proteobacteria bacterium SG_bin9]|nr:MAG: hypothetical protein A4S14_16385 [Proteobacteria bacterium SG_bin9]
MGSVAIPAEAARVLDKWTKAFCASDVDGIVGLYSEDAIFVGTGSTTVVTEPGGVRAYFENALLNNRPRGATLASYETTVLSDTAVAVSGLDAVSGVRDGVPFSNSGRITFVIAKRGVEWKIVHFHRSAMPR